MDREVVVYTQWNTKKEQNCVLCSNMDGTRGSIIRSIVTRGYYAGWKQLERRNRNKMISLIYVYVYTYIYLYMWHKDTQQGSSKSSKATQWENWFYTTGLVVRVWKGSLGSLRREVGTLMMSIVLESCPWEIIVNSIVNHRTSINKKFL